MDTNDQHRDDAAENNAEKDSQKNEQANDTNDQQSTNQSNSSHDENKSNDKDNSNDGDKDNQSFNKESLLADLHKERSTRKALKEEVAKLTADVANFKEVESERDALQAKYNRLEEFLLTVGGDISKALDSRSFTKDLFESDKGIKEIVESWNKANPSAVGSALSGSSQSNGKPTMNDLLRAAR